MSLRQRPQVSSRTIAANRANAQKSTRPRRKARVTLNARKHEATAQKLFRSHLVCPGRTWPCTTGCTVRFVFTSAPWARARGRRPIGRRGRPSVVAGGPVRRVCGEAKGLSAARSGVCCGLRPAGGGSGTKPECDVKSIDSRLTFLLRIRIEISKTGIRPQSQLRSRCTVWPAPGSYRLSRSPRRVGFCSKRCSLEVSWGGTGRVLGVL